MVIKMMWHYLENLQLEEIIAIGLDGRMTEVAGEYAGLKPKQARTKIIEDLESKDL